MKNISLFNSIATAAFAMVLVSCGGGNDYKTSSRATGWDITGRNGFELNTDYSDQDPAPGLVFVEGGTFTMGRVKDDPMHDWNNTPNQQHVQSFYIDETEVTNGMYLEMLYWIKDVFPQEEEKYRAIYNGAVPDTLVWRNSLGFNEEMTNNYLRFPSYANYPVVGVSWIQAVEFCNWRTDRVNEKILMDQGYTAEGSLGKSSATELFNTDTYLNAPTLVYGGNDEITRGGKKSDKLQSEAEKKAADTESEAQGLYVTREDGILLPGSYRLPTEAEWEYAALGLGSLREYNSYRGRKKYPWDGQYTRAGGRKNKGDHLANFKQGNGDYGGIAGWSDDGADITTKIKSYEPNDFGVYDMAGNVSEWVADVYRPMIDSEFNDFNYYRGNVYTKNSIGPDGLISVVSPDSIDYDTLSTGKIIARTIPGQIKQVPIDEEETYLRTNFDRSDNRNFRDGDPQSSKYFLTGDELDPDQKMYDAPMNKISVDSDGNYIREYDQSNTRTSLIDDEVRVIKGGSWRDREYWLDPATRRFYKQDMSRDDIGFRCAMSRVGSKTNKGKSPRN